MKRIVCLVLLPSAVLLSSLASAASAADVSQPVGVLRPANERFGASRAAEVPHLQRHVLPLLGHLGCNGRACHGSFQGQGGFRLSLFGYDFKMDHEALVKSEESRVDLKDLRHSLMLTKPTGTEDDHGGGHRLDVESWEYRLLLRWIEAGAAAVQEETDPQFVRLEVSPLEIVFKKPGETARLRAICHWSDGTAEDVTPLCRFTTNDEAVAKANSNGQITVTGKGDTHIVVYYDNGVVPVSVMLPVSDQVGPNFPAVATPTKVDELVVAKLRKLGVVPSEQCTDAEFLRRASLDITGALPWADEVQAFLADKSSDKRARKVDELLERPAYAAWWSTKLCDLLGNSENQLRKGVIRSESNEQWYRWINRRVAENMPYDKLVEGIVMAVSRSSPDQTYQQYCEEMTSYFRPKDPSDFAAREAMPWYWARQNMRKPNEKALSFSYAFLGVRLQCAECHKHPFDQWSQQDFQQFTAFFNRVNYGTMDRKGQDMVFAALKVDPKQTANNKRDKLLAEAIREGKVIPFDEVYISKSTLAKYNKDDAGKKIDAGRVITPKVLGGEELVDTKYADPRQPLMDWLRQKDNPYFARALVNRIWAGYFNVGIVEPPDDMNLANAPSNKQLLDYLASAFIEQGFDLKWLHREIVNSRAYQASWQTNPTNEFDLRNFSHALPRRLPAEVVLDAVANAAADEQTLDARRQDPIAKCTIGMRGYTQRQSGGNSYALSVFGKPKRETPCDCERSNEPSLLQTVFLRNDAEIFAMIDKGGWLKQATATKSTATEDRSELQKEITQLSTRLKTLGKKDKKDLYLDGILQHEKQQREAQQKLERLQAKHERAARQIAEGDSQRTTTAASLITQAYLRTFSRLPSAEELARGEKYVTESESLEAGVRDVLWALMNSKEFVVNH